MKTGRLAAMLLSLAALPGCGDKQASFSLLADSDTFIQDKGSKTISKLDILWVIDNSGSMPSSQQNVASNFTAFIEDFNSKSYDYQIAVTTTEAYKAYFSGNQNWSRFRDGTSQTGFSGVKIITPTTPNLESVFMKNIIQGTLG